jgi:hypothetical protein
MRGTDASEFKFMKRLEDRVGEMAGTEKASSFLICKQIIGIVLQILPLGSPVFLRLSLKGNKGFPQ